MKSYALSFKNILIYYIIFILVNFSNSSLLKGMQEDEETTYIPRSSRVVLLDDLLPLQGEIDLHDSYLLRSSGSGTLVNEFHPHSLEESEEDPTLINGISKLYVTAFQEDLENGTSWSKALKYIICLGGGLGPFIPQIVIAKTIGENFDSDLLGYALIVTSAISIEAITSWMIWELIDDTNDLIKSMRRDKAYAGTCNCSIIKSAIIGSASLLLGVLSSAPDVYIKYEYNDIKWFALISLVYDSIPRVIGFYKFFSSLKLDKINRILKTQNVEECNASKIINISKANFLQKCKENGIESVCESLRNCTSPSEIYSYLTSNVPLNLQEENSARDSAKSLSRKGIKYFSIILPTASATFNIAMAYKGFKLILDNEPVLGLLSAFSVMPTFFLSSYVVMEAVENVFDKIHLWRSRIPSSDYFTSFHPKVNLILLVTSLLLASATSFANFNLISDNLEDTILEPIKYGIAALSVGTDFTFGAFIIYTILKRYGEILYKKFSPVGTSYVINCAKKLNELGNSFVNFGSNFIRGFIYDIMPERLD